MQIPLLCRRGLAVVAGIGLLAFSGWVSADPPSRVARLGYTAGAVSLSPAGEDEWVRATLNRPLTQGDRLWSDTGARAEVQVGGATVRMNAGTGISVLNLDDRIVQLQLTQGRLNVRVHHLEPGQIFEVDTPNLAFTLGQPGEYRIEFDPSGDATTIVVRQGQGEVYGETASYVVDARQPYRFTGTDLRDYAYVDTPRLDDFDRWARARDRADENSESARYVSRDVVGYQDLDAHGSWRVDAQYGNVWMPSRVAQDWAPYRDGHWAWVDPWGWTWVDNEPWGFAVSHYGRWANFNGRWGWVPGPVQQRAYYAPALVVFVGGANFQISASSGNVGGIGWFPLAPREVYRPPFPVSRGYFENVNRSNTVVNNTVIYNTYNNTNVTNVVYVNRQVPGAVVAVPTTIFAQSQPVSRAAIRVTRDMIATAPVAAIPHIAPTERSVRGAAGPGEKPPQRVFERPVVARTAPPAAPIGFAAQQAQLAARPGQPLDDTARKALKPAAAVPAPVVNVVAPAQTAPPTARPPAVAPDRKPDEKRARPDDRSAAAEPAARNGPPQAAPTVPPPKTPESRGQPVQPVPVQPVPVQPVPVKPELAEPRGQPGGKPEARGNDAPRGQAATPPPQRGTEPKAPPPPAAAPPQRAQPQAQPPGPSVQPSVQPSVPPAVQPAEQPRGKPEPRSQGEPRGQQAAQPPPGPQRAAEPKAEAARQAEPGRPPPAQDRSASQAEPRGQKPKPEPKPETGKSDNKKNRETS